MARVGLGDWTIRSETDAKYHVLLANVDQAHADTVLRDLIENQWVPSDLVLERVPVKRKRWRWRRG